MACYVVSLPEGLKAGRKEGHNLLSGRNAPDGDPLIKRIFSNREVLAWLLVHFIDEYRGCTVREVMEKYLPKARLDIGRIPVHPGEAPPESVPTGNVEDRQLAERTTMFDVLLMLPSPGRPGRSIGVVIDIEVQKKNDPGYPIESRMIYYLCRSVSKQRDVTFSGDGYGDIAKCYSLWFCPRLAKGESRGSACSAKAASPRTRRTTTCSKAARSVSTTTPGSL